MKRASLKIINPLYTFMLNGTSKNGSSDALVQGAKNPFMKLLKPAIQVEFEESWELLSTVKSQEEMEGLKIAANRGLI